MEFLPWRADRVSIDGFLEARVAIARREGFERRGQEELSRFLISELWNWLRDPGLVHHAEIPVFAPGEPGVWIDGVLDLLCLKTATDEITVIDWKTNRRRRGELEGTFLDRLSSTYRPQLMAYAKAIVQALGGGDPVLKVYSTVCGKTVPIESG